jgi:L-threonylcarbamoyladenylate synthase
MHEVITREEAEIRREEIKRRIIDGAVFIYPTDTIYGIGCNALDSGAVRKVRELKGRPNTPFSIIAPSREWVEEHCHVHKRASKWVKRLPGPLTLILKAKKAAVAPEVAPGIDTIGVRAPNHWFTKFIEELNIPIITTSANKVGKMFMKSLDDLDPAIRMSVDFIIYEGEKAGKPSDIVHLEEEKRKLAKVIPLPTKVEKRKAEASQKKK